MVYHSVYVIETKVLSIIVIEFDRKEIYFETMRFQSWVKRLGAMMFHQAKTVFVAKDTLRHRLLQMYGQCTR